MADDLDSTFLDFTDPYAVGPMAQQRALSVKVRRNPALVMPSSGVEKQPSASAGAGYAPQGGGAVANDAPAAASAAPSRLSSDEILAQISSRIGKRPDADQHIDYAQQRADDSDRKTMLGLTLAAMGGESFRPVAGHILQQAMKTSGDYEIPGGWGVIGRDGRVTWNEAKQEEADLGHLTRLLSIQERSDAARREDSRRREEALGRREDRRLLAAAAGGRRADAADARQDAATARRTDAVRREYNARRDKINAGAGFSDGVVQMLADPNIAKSAPGQVALVMQFGKMLDPDSVVREAEQRMIAQARGWFDSLMITPERIMSGQFLTPQQLNQMMSIARQYQGGYAQRVSDLDGYYEGLATRNQLPVADIVQRSGGAASSEPPAGSVRPRNPGQSNTRRSTDAAPDAPPEGAVRPRSR